MYRTDKRLNAAAEIGTGLEGVQQADGECLGGCKSMGETKELILQRAISHWLAMR